MAPTGDSTETPAPVFRVRCPRCAAKADGLMFPGGARVTYRDIHGGAEAEAWVRGVRLHRVLCSHCGLARVVGDPGEYELWYRTSFKSHTLWACNEEHIESLIAALDGGRSMTGTPYEALPKWMVTDREQVIAALRKLESRG